MIFYSLSSHLVPAQPLFLIVVHNAIKIYSHEKGVTRDMVLERRILFLRLRDRCNCYFSFWAIFCATDRQMDGQEKWQRWVPHLKIKEAPDQFLCNLLTGVTEEIRIKIVMLNAKKQTKVVVDQMFSKYLTIRRNNALKRQCQLLNNLDNNLQVKLIYPATLKIRPKGLRDRWETLEIQWHCELKNTE